MQHTYVCNVSGACAQGLESEKQSLETRLEKMRAKIAEGITDKAAFGDMLQLCEQLRAEQDEAKELAQSLQVKCSPIDI